MRGDEPIGSEAGAALHGTLQESSIAELWAWAEGIWNDPRTQPWQPPLDPPLDEQIEPELLALIAEAAKDNPTVYTLGRAAKPNFVRDVTAAGLWVETQRSRMLQSDDAGGLLVKPRCLELSIGADR